jgi:pilus assembly protein CpaF
VPARLEALAALGGMTPGTLRSQVAAAIQVVLHVRRRGDGLRVLEGVGVVRRGDAEGLVVVPAWGREGGWAAGRADLGAMFAERGVDAPWPGAPASGRAGVAGPALTGASPDAEPPAGRPALRAGVASLRPVGSA